MRLQRIEPDLTGASEQVGRLDAFLVREPDGRLRRTVYINARSELLLAATSAPDRYVAVLASVLFHEWRHLEGDSEGEARAAEPIFLRGLARRGLLTPAEA